MTQALIIGGNGYVGKAYRSYFEKRSVSYNYLSRSKVDCTSPDLLVKHLKTLRPRFLINCAGYIGKPNVDDCELHKAECIKANILLPLTIRLACEQVGIPWAHISSGCIYTGTPNNNAGFSEVYSPNFSFVQNNCSFYSGSKAMGEEVLTPSEKCYIWRIRVPFNEVDGPRNYLSKIMGYERLLEARNSLTQIDEAVRASIELLHNGSPFGTYNLTNPGSITTSEVTELILRSGVCKKEFKFFSNEAEFMSVAAKTPRSSCVLDSSKLQSMGVHMTEIHEAVEIALRNWRKN